MISTIDAPVKTNATPTTLEIKGQRYQATTYTPEAEGYRNGVRLEKRDGTVYDLVDGPHGCECDCPDFIARHAGHRTKGCKHIQAARAAGLLTSPDPTARKVEPARPSIPGVTRVRDEFDDAVTNIYCEPTPARPIDATAKAQAAAFGVKLPPAPVVTSEPAPLVEGEDGRRDDAGEDLGYADPIDEFDDEDEGGWDGWEDDGVWNLGPEPDAHVPTARTARTFSLDGYIDHEADRYRAMGTGAGRLIADQLATLARSVRFMHARTPDAYLGRVAALDAGRWGDQGEPDDGE